MRISKVIGKVTLNKQLKEILPGSYLVVRPLNRGSLVGKNAGNDEELVLFDQLAAREGDLVGMAEGREATSPFAPKRVPYDAYNAAIIDTVNFTPVLEIK